MSSDPVRKDLWLFGTPIAHSASPIFQNTIFETLNLPHRYNLHDTASTSSPSFLALLRSSTFAGCAITMPLKTEAMAVVDTLEPEAAAIGSINTIILRPDPTTGQPTLVGQNYDWEGVRESIRNRLPVEQQRLDAPFGAGRSGVVIGGGGTTRAAVYALSRMALSPIYLVNRDPDETQAIVASFPQFDLRAVESVEEWDAACEDAIACVVGAIPSFEPVTEGEKKVYAVAAKLFGGRVNDGRVRYFLEMCYKPRVTILYKMAEAQGWIVVPGVEAVQEQGLAQARAWLLNSLASPYKGVKPADLDPEAVEKARAVVRGMGDIKAVPSV